MRIEVSGQVLGFLRELAPEPRREIRMALRELAAGKGDIRPLEGAFSGFYRLRVGRYRLVFRYHAKGRGKCIRCEFAEARSIVYLMYSEMLKHLT